MAPLVLLHGYPFDHTMWDPVMEQLKDSFKIITPDLPGFGAEPLSTKEPAIEVMADHVASMLDRQNAARAVIAGFSMGGYVALALAERHPARLSGLALINSQPFADTDEVRAGRRTMIEKVRREGPDAALKGALPKLFALGKSSDPKLAAYPARGAAKAGANGITWALEAMARRPDRTAMLEKLSVPLLILHSTEDQFINIDRIRPLKGKFPRADYVEISDAGHCTPLEQPIKVAQALGTLMAKVVA